MRSYSKEIVRSIQNHVEENDLCVSFDEEEGNFDFVLNVPGTISILHYTIQVLDHDYVVTASCPVRPDAGDPAMMATMAEFLCRANYGLKNGGFQMDFRKGNLTFRCYVNCEDAYLSDKMIRASIGVPAAMMRHYAKGIVGVLFQGMDAEDAVILCENPLAMRGAQRRAQREKPILAEEAPMESLEDFVHRMEQGRRETEEDGLDPEDEELLRLMEAGIRASAELAASAGEESDRGSEGIFHGILEKIREAAKAAEAVMDDGDEVEEVPEGTDIA